MKKKEVSVAIGRFGPYVKHDSKFISIKKDDNPESIKLERAIELIEAKRKVEREKIIKIFPEDDKVQLLNGRYGAYMVIDKQNYKLPKGTDAASLTLEECYKISEDPKNMPKKDILKRK